MAKSIKELKKIKTLVTHNGVMHGDDVIATAFLMCAGGIIGHSFKVERVNSSVAKKYVNDPAYLVFDVGNGPYDHHDKNNLKFRKVMDPTTKEFTVNGIPYAAIGLLWNDFGESYLSEIYRARTGATNEELVKKYFKIFDSRYISTIDGRDNATPGIKSNISDTISCMNQQGNGPGANFDNAVFWAQTAFVAWTNSIISDMISSHELDQAISVLDEDETILPLSHFISFNGIHEKCPSIRYVIYPSSRDPGCWCAQTISYNGELLYPFNPSKSLYKDMVFIHSSGFMATAKSREAIIAACDRNDELIKRKEENNDAE